MRISIIGLIVLGLVAAFSAALLVAAMGSSRGSALASSGNDSEVTLLVARRDLPRVTVVRIDDFEQRTMSAKDAPRDAITEPLKIIGQTLARPVVEGQALTHDCFASNKRGLDLVSTLPPGKRAVTVELTLSAGLDGLLYPGSVVDVLASFKLRNSEQRDGMAVSTTLLSGVTVLAIDEETVTANDESNGEAKSDTLTRHKTRRVTLLVDSRQAEELQLATEHGTVSLAMRNPHDAANTDRDAMLLSGGQLASLAEYLGGSVDSGDSTAVGTGENARPASRSPKAWEVLVLRGTEVDVQTFANKEAGQTAE
jgi:pilus assembly protein CpaB